MLWSQEILVPVRMMDSLRCAGEDSVEITGGALRTSQPAEKQVCAKALEQDLLSVFKE